MDLRIICHRYFCKIPYIELRSSDPCSYSNAARAFIGRLLGHKESNLVESCLMRLHTSRLIGFNKYIRSTNEIDAQL